jgi:hypothetical protein
MSKKITLAEWVAAIIAAIVCAVLIEGVRLLRWSVMTAVLTAVTLALLYVGLLCIRIRARNRQLKAKMTLLEQELALRKVPPVANHLVDYMEHLRADGKRFHFLYPYTYHLVRQEAEVDEFGNYTGTYTHEAVNDSDKPLLVYTFVLRTTSRANFDDLKTQAWVEIGNKVVQKADPSSNNSHAPDTHLHVKVTFPSPVNVGVRFKVILKFKWPKALRRGQDGDAIDFG